jgi:hypothetical protein
VPKIIQESSVIYKQTQRIYIILQMGKLKLGEREREFWCIIFGNLMRNRENRCKLKDHNQHFSQTMPAKAWRMYVEMDSGVANKEGWNMKLDKGDCIVCL